MHADDLTKWCARTAIDATAVGVGIATLPISVPLLGAVKALRAPGRVIAVNVMDGTVPLVGPPLARALDGFLYEAA